MGRTSLGSVLDWKEGRASLESLAVSEPSVGSSLDVRSSTSSGRGWRETTSVARSGESARDDDEREHEHSDSGLEDIPSYSMLEYFASAVGGDGVDDGHDDGAGVLSPSTIPSLIQRFRSAPPRSREQRAKQSAEWDVSLSMQARRNARAKSSTPTPSPQSFSTSGTTKSSSKTPMTNRPSQQQQQRLSQTPTADTENDDPSVGMAALKTKRTPTSARGVTHGLSRSPLQPLTVAGHSLDVVEAHHHTFKKSHDRTTSNRSPRSVRNSGDRPSSASSRHVTHRPVKGLTHLKPFSFESPPDSPEHNQEDDDPVEISIRGIHASLNARSQERASMLQWQKRLSSTSPFPALSDIGKKTHQKLKNDSSLADKLQSPTKDILNSTRDQVKKELDGESPKEEASAALPKTSSASRSPSPSLAPHQHHKPPTKSSQSLLSSTTRGDLSSDTFSSSSVNLADTTHLLCEAEMSLGSLGRNSFAIEPDLAATLARLRKRLGLAEDEGAGQPTTNALSKEPKVKASPSPSPSPSPALSAGLEKNSSASVGDSSDTSAERVHREKVQREIQTQTVCVKGGIDEGVETDLVMEVTPRTDQSCQTTEDLNQQQQSASLQSNDPTPSPRLDDASSYTVETSHTAESSMTSQDHPHEPHHHSTSLESRDKEGSPNVVCTPPPLPSETPVIVHPSRSAASKDSSDDTPTRAPVSDSSSNNLKLPPMVHITSPTDTQVSSPSSSSSSSSVSFKEKRQGSEGGKDSPAATVFASKFSKNPQLEDVDEEKHLDNNSPKHVSSSVSHLHNSNITDMSSIRASHKSIGSEVVIRSLSKSNDTARSTLDFPSDDSPQAEPAAKWKRDEEMEQGEAPKEEAVGIGPHRDEMVPESEMFHDAAAAAQRVEEGATEQVEPAVSKLSPSPSSHISPSSSSESPAQSRHSSHSKSSSDSDKEVVHVTGDGVTGDGQVDESQPALTFYASVEELSGGSRSSSQVEAHGSYHAQERPSFVPILPLHKVSDSPSVEAGQNLGAAGATCEKKVPPTTKAPPTSSPTHHHSGGTKDCMASHATTPPRVVDSVTSIPSPVAELSELEKRIVGAKVSRSVVASTLSAESSSESQDNSGARRSVSFDLPSFQSSASTRASGERTGGGGGVSDLSFRLPECNDNNHNYSSRTSHSLALSQSVSLDEKTSDRPMTPVSDLSDTNPTTSDLGVSSASSSSGNPSMPTHGNDTTSSLIHQTFGHTHPLVSPVSPVPPSEFDDKDPTVKMLREKEQMFINVLALIQFKKALLKEEAETKS